MQIRDEYKLEVVKDLAWHICGKGVVLESSSDVKMHQTERNIVGGNWVEVLHEIAHWLVADPKYKQYHNLGLVEISPDDDMIEYPQYQRIFEEECVALVLTRLLANRLFDNEDSGYFRYLAFLFQRSSDLCDEFGIGFEGVRDKARAVFNKTIVKYPLKFQDMECYI
jgi:hypothetical protein